VKRTWTTNAKDDYGNCRDCGVAVTRKNTRSNYGRNDTQRAEVVCGRCYLKQRAEERKRRGLE